MTFTYLKSYLLKKGHYDVKPRFRFFSDEESDWWDEQEMAWIERNRKEKMSNYKARKCYFPLWWELQMKKNPKCLDKEGVKSKVDMVSLYRLYFPDRRIAEHGSRYRQVQCPWHDDKHASMSLDTELKLFNCFGCGEKGDCFVLVMKATGVRFSQAVSILNGL